MLNGRIFFWLPLLIMSIGAFCNEAKALQIVYPSDRTYVTKSDYLIVKGGEPLLDAMTITVNGLESDMIPVSSPEYRRAFKDMLILELDLDPGENKIVAKGYVGGKLAGRTEATVHYFADLEHVPPAGFRPFVMHVKENEDLCAGCHNMQPNDAATNRPMTSGNACASCHKRMLSKKHVHGPAGVGECGNCHSNNRQFPKYQIKPEEVGGLCLGCHDDLDRLVSKMPHVHGPIAVGDCTVCHDPHASDHPLQLIAPGNELCLMCHDVLKIEAHVVRGIIGASHPLSGPVNPNNPEKPFGCISCHTPHAAKSAQYFQGGLTSKMGLCQLCHKK